MPTAPHARVFRSSFDDMTIVDQDLLPASLPPERRGWRTADLARASVVALAVWFGLQLAWSVSSLLFLIFLATLFGLAVGSGVDYLERFKIRRGIAAALIVLGTLGAIGSGLLGAASLFAAPMTGGLSLGGLSGLIGGGATLGRSLGGRL